MGHIVHAFEESKVQAKFEFIFLAPLLPERRRVDLSILSPASHWHLILLLASEFPSFLSVNFHKLLSSQAGFGTTGSSLLDRSKSLKALSRTQSSFLSHLKIILYSKNDALLSRPL